MNRALKKYKKAKYKNIRLCPLNWTIDYLFKIYGHVVIDLRKGGES